MLCPDQNWRNVALHNSYQILFFKQQSRLTWLYVSKSVFHLETSVLLSLWIKSHKQIQSGIQKWNIFLFSSNYLVSPSNKPPFPRPHPHIKYGQCIRQSRHYYVSLASTHSYSPRVNNFKNWSMLLMNFHIINNENIVLLLLL